jgi:hypothetical protein
MMFLGLIGITRGGSMSVTGVGDAFVAIFEALDA